MTTRRTIPAKRLNKFPEYVFSKLAKMVKEIEKESGRKVLNFGPGTPDVRPSQIYIKKLNEFIKEKDSHLYPGYGAIPELSEGLTSWYKKRFGVTLKNDELFPLLGAKDGVSHIPFALCDAGDEILIPDPGYPGYVGPTLIVGGKTVFYDLSIATKNPFKDLENKITKKTKYIWVTSLLTQQVKLQI